MIIFEGDKITKRHKKGTVKKKKAVTGTDKFFVSVIAFLEVRSQRSEYLHLLAFFAAYLYSTSKSLSETLIFSLKLIFTFVMSSLETVTGVITL